MHKKIYYNNKIKKEINEKKEAKFDIYSPTLLLNKLLELKTRIQLTYGVNCDGGH